MAEPTPWERREIESIDKLPERCLVREFAFRIQEDHISEATIVATTPSEELVAQRLRYFATDLYSVLDYLCYLFYCHFRNNGEPSDSREARNVTFPFKFNLRTSPNHAQEAALKDLRNEFLSGKSNILGLEGEMSNRYQELILDCQIITHVEGDGTTPVEPQPPPTDNAKALNVLHYLRNCTIHRHLIHPHVETGWLYYNRQNGSHEIVLDQIPDRDPGIWASCRAPYPAYWIEFPSMGNGIWLQAVTTVAQRLRSCVVNIRDQLLELVFPGQFPNFDATNRVRFDCIDGLHIGNRHYPKDDFVEQSLNATDLWAI